MVLSILGVIAVYSATRGPGPDFSKSYLYKQTIFMVIGAGALFFCSVVDYRKLHDWAWAFYGITTAL
ncbi:MAG: hypothetical protein JHC63_09705, partial [Acidimicrobiia bacterium]|nr:hypothetical protein [Acidimicrobiia bacterium]